MNELKRNLSIDGNQEKCEETEGFDIQAGLTWIYPMNYPLRDYQYNIIEQALFKNTLVNLPTGLGKTFIAAVVMFNYYRWYPTGKIVFMAPTRPLVKQQIDACYNIMAIPKDVTAELTGSNKNSMRNDIWMDKRVFFVTPQVLQNDLDNCPELAALIKCIVFDEAHKARGNYAYCQVLKKIKSQAKYFRVLALSATPGNSINDVGEVINTLMISHLEYRTEESEDVKPFVFQRKLVTVIVPLDEKLNQVKNDYMKILENYSRTLLKYKVIQGHCSSLSKGAIFRIKREYQEKRNRDPHYKEVSVALNICMSLYHANDLLIRHGLRGFLNYFEEHINDPLLRNNIALVKIMEDIRSYLGPMPLIDRLPDGSYPEVPSSIPFGHPKFYKLRDILISHFNNSEDSSKVIVFFEYRDSVKEALFVLLQARPIIRPEMFVGQKSGVVTQKMQLRVIKTFRDGDCNTLLSTSIGEEGLDVGEVDLIICFDISSKSPIRMVQRMGRTGRKREGKVVILVTEGREQQTLNDCLFHKNNMKGWAGSKELMKNFFVESPRMVPKEINPQCMKMQITVTKPTVTRNSSIKNLIRNMSSASNVSEDVELIEIEEKIPDQMCLFNKSRSEIKKIDFKPFCLDYIEHQRVFQHSTRVVSSDASKLFVNLMKFADAKRFNIPLTQDSHSSKNLKQGDIRNMFRNIGAKSTIEASQGDFMTQVFSLPTQKELSREEIENKELHKKLHSEISIYLSIQESTTNDCNFCGRGFPSWKYTSKKNMKFFEEADHWIPPNPNFFEEISLKDLECYLDSKVQQRIDISSELIDAEFSDSLQDEKIESTKSFNFDMPESFGNLLNKYDISSTFSNQKQYIGIAENRREKLTPPSDVTEFKNQIQKENIPGMMGEDDNLDSVLSFFKLDKIEDIFEEGGETSNDSDNTIIDIDMANNLECERESSPVLNTEISQKRRVSRKITGIGITKPGSPVLNSSMLCRSQNDMFKGRPSLDIIDTSIEEKNALTIPKKFSQRLCIKPSLTKDEDNDRIELKTKKSGSTNSEEENLLRFFSSKKRTTYPNNSTKCHNPLSLNDLFDLWAFGLKIEDIEKELNPSQVPLIERENIKEMEKHDLKNFSMLINAESTRIEKENEENIDRTYSSFELLSGKVTNEDSSLGSKNQEKIISVPEIDDFCDLSIFGLTEHEETSNSKYTHSNNVASMNEGNETLNFSNCIGAKYMSTQIEVEKGYIKSTEGKETTKQTSSDFDQLEVSKLPYVEEIYGAGEINHANDIVIIDDSPIKDDFIDLTQSPKRIVKPPAKRKILSQISISQILSLAEKPTQSILLSRNSSQGGINQSSSSKNTATSTSKSKNTFESEQNTKQKKIPPDISRDLGNTHEKSISKCSTSLLDGLRNSDEFEESLCFEDTSPVFKIPSTNRKNVHKYRKTEKSEHNRKSEVAKKNIINTVDIDENLYNPTTTQMLGNSISDSNSDDEFENTIIPGSISNKEQNLHRQRNDSSPKIPKKKVRKKTRISCFIEEEAEVSIDKGSVSDDESDEDGSFDESFVDDETQNIENDINIQANYLQSIRSSSTGPTFKMPKALRPITDDIFSQPADRNESNLYVTDSFCVETQDMIEESHELSELEILEQKLKRMRKKRKEIGKENKVVKRRRIRIIESDSE